MDDQEDFLVPSFKEVEHLRLPRASSIDVHKNGLTWDEHMDDTC